jgi:L-asparaginase
VPAAVTRFHERMNAARVVVARLSGGMAISSSGLGRRDTAAPLGTPDSIRLSRDAAGFIVHPTALASVSGACLTFEDILKTLNWARSTVVAGASAVVVAQDTDTIEETAYLLDLYWGRAEPLIVTGAMRPAHAPGADGPANLAAAIAVATSSSSRNRGVLVVLNDEIHAAARVRQSHSSAPNAFCSPMFGPVGYVIAGNAVYRETHLRARKLSSPPSEPARVALLETSFDDRGELLDIVARAGYEGVVVAGFGAGCVSDAFADVIESYSQLPIVVASRTGAGTTYAGADSGSDLESRGVILAGSLDARKARILLCCLLAVGSSRAEIAAEFHIRGFMI